MRIINPFKRLVRKNGDAPTVIPVIINNYRVYDDSGLRLVGIGDEMELPEIKTESYTLEGAGLMGKFVQPTYGILEPMEMSLPFSVFYGDIESYAGIGSDITFVIRASIQMIDTVSAKDNSRGIKVDVSGKVTGVNPGKMKQGEQMDSSCSLSVYYLRIGTSKDGFKYRYIKEIDIFNDIYKVGGKDMLSALKKIK